jgi:Fe-S-cluster containining protein
MTEHPHDDDGLLDEYRAVVAKVDAAVATISARAADALACRRGCDSCCAPGLTVLPVEAESIARHLESHDVVAGTRADRCTFLESDGACRIYPVRPLLCRTHGLALKAATSRPGLTVVDDVSHCALNYTTRGPGPAEVLDAERLLALLVTVDRRFRAAAGFDDDDERVALTALLSG